MVCAPTATAHGPQRLSLFLHLTKQDGFPMVVSEDEEACKLPPQRRVTSQVMHHWAQHKAIAANAPNVRQRHLDALHKAQDFDAISLTKASESGHSILQSDVPDGEEIDCEPSKRRQSLRPCILPVLLPAAYAKRAPRTPWSLRPSLSARPASLATPPPPPRSQ